METPETRLAQLADTIRNLEVAPLFTFRQENGYQLVFGEGNPQAKLIFIGEAPGRQEAETGKPFVGRAGQLLDSLLGSIQLQRQDVYITNIVKDRPPKNRNPLKEEIAFYTSFLIQQIQIIQPQIIATLGRFAMDFLLELYQRPEQGQTIGDMHGRPLQCDESFGAVILFPLYHPAAVFYNRSLEELLRTDFLLLADLITDI